MSTGGSKSPISIMGIVTTFLVFVIFIKNIIELISVKRYELNEIVYVRSYKLIKNEFSPFEDDKM